VKLDFTGFFNEMPMQITPKEFKDRFSELIILDIRTPYEIEEFDLGGIQIPLDELLMNIEHIEYLKNQEVIIICYTGLQSKIAQKILEKRGFKNLKNLEGGLEAYLALSYEQ
jgi:rhodanese-related sulfurtransferase